MKLNRNAFINILSMHQNNLDKKAINPIFSCIKIESNDSTLKIISSDGQRYLESTIQGSFQNFSIFINGTTLYELIKKSKAEFFEIKDVYECYKILIDNAEFKFSKQIYDNFPIWNEDDKNKFSINAKILSDGLKMVKWSASTEESRPSLNGICIDITDNKTLNLCATDSLRLALMKINGTFNFQGKWILGKKSTLDLIKILDECGNDNINVYLGKNIKISYEKTEKQILWQSLLVAGSFPPYEKAIPKESFASYTVEAKQLLEILDRILIIANQNQPIIILKLNEEDSKIFAENSISSGEDHLPGEYIGSNLKISLNGKFLQEMLNNLSDKITFQIKDPLSPIVIKNVNNNGSLFIIAPVR